VFLILKKNINKKIKSSKNINPKKNKKNLKSSLEIATKCLKLNYLNGLPVYIMLQHLLLLLLRDFHSNKTSY